MAKVAETATGARVKKRDSKQVTRRERSILQHLKLDYGWGKGAYNAPPGDLPQNLKTKADIDAKSTVPYTAPI